MKHTPGPWSVDSWGDVRAEGGKFVGSVVTTWDASEENWKDNGRLMAAAPELLEALKGAEWSNGGFCPQCCRGRAHKEGHHPQCVIGNAIAKAEGRQ